MSDVTFEGKDRKKMKSPTSYLELSYRKIISLMVITNGWGRLDEGTCSCQIWSDRTLFLIYKQPQCMEEWIGTWQSHRRSNSWKLRNYFNFLDWKWQACRLFIVWFAKEGISYGWISTSTFLNCFATVHGEFPCQDFRPLGWVHSARKGGSLFW